jgi:hypothetical protein
MSAMLYWKERLLTGMPFYASKMYVEGLNYKPNRKDPTSPWPHSVARSAFYADYCIWHNEAYLPQFKDQPHYKEYPEDLPMMADELGFFATIAPWLYVVGKSRQVRSYAVTERVHQDGEWHEARRKRYFVRLCSREVHVAAFELFTGTDLIGPGSVPWAENHMTTLARAQQECREVTEINRASVPNVS